MSLKMNFWNFLFDETVTYKNINPTPPGIVHPGLSGNSLL